MIFHATFFANPSINIIVKNCDTEKQSVSHQLSLRLIFLMFPWDLHRTKGETRHSAVTETNSEAGRNACRLHSHADKQADTQMDGHTGTLTGWDRKTNCETNGQWTERQTDMQVTAACHSEEVSLHNSRAGGLLTKQHKWKAHFYITSWNYDVAFFTNITAEHTMGAMFCRHDCQTAIWVSRWWHTDTGTNWMEEIAGNYWKRNRQSIWVCVWALPPP